MMTSNNVRGSEAMQPASGFSLSRERSRFAEPPVYGDPGRPNTSNDPPKLTISPKASSHPQPRVTIQGVQSHLSFGYFERSSSSYAPPLNPDVRMEELPFYPVLDCLMKPQTLGKYGYQNQIEFVDRLHYYSTFCASAAVATTPPDSATKIAKFSFTLTPQQAQSIHASLVRSPSGLTKPGTQVFLEST
jgi:hypothetical protein